MDVVVSQTADGDRWELTDLLGRSMGAVLLTADGCFIEPDGEAIETMTRVEKGPYPNLDAALKEIETRTRGVCRRDFASRA